MDDSGGNSIQDAHETLCRHVPDVVIVVDGDGCLRYLSPAVSTFGYDAKALVGEPLLDYVHEEDVNTVETWLSTGPASTEAGADSHAGVPLVELRFRTATNEWSWIELAGSGEHVDSLGGRVFSVRDVSERNWRENQLSKQIAHLEDFTGLVSHDLQAPLSVASGSLELYRRTGDEEALDRVERAHDRLQHLTSDLLALAREGVVVDDPQPVSLHDCVLRALAMSPLPNEQATVDELPTVRADPNRVQSLLENLFRNAVEHGTSDTQVWVDALPDGFAVEDDGPGIEPDAVDHVFEVGYSGDPQGTGFGLNIVKRITDAHGWNVSVTTGTRAGGARFEVRNVDIVDENDGTGENDGTTSDH